MRTGRFDPESAPASSVVIVSSCRVPTGVWPRSVPGSAASIEAYLEAGFDEVYIHQIGTDQEPFLRFYRDGVIPKLAL